MAAILIPLLKPKIINLGHVCYWHCCEKPIVERVLNHRHFEHLMFLGRVSEE